MAEEIFKINLLQPQAEVLKNKSYVDRLYIVGHMIENAEEEEPFGLYRR